MNNTTKEIGAGLVWGGGVLVVALGASQARRLGLIDDDTVKRLVFGVWGLLFAWYGNRMAKVVVPSACASRARRFSSWSMVLSGLAYAGLFAFAPIPTATWGGSAVLVAGVVATLGYCLSQRFAPRAG